MKLFSLCEDNVVSFPRKRAANDAQVQTGLGDGTIRSLFTALTDPDYSEYRVKDVLTLNDRIGDVIAANPANICLKFRDNGETAIVDRRAPNLEPAPVNLW